MLFSCVIHTYMTLARREPLADSPWRNVEIGRGVDSAPRARRADVDGLRIPELVGIPGQLGTLRTGQSAAPHRPGLFRAHGPVRILLRRRPGLAGRPMHVPLLPVRPGATCVHHALTGPTDILPRPRIGGSLIAASRPTRPRPVTDSVGNACGFSVEGRDSPIISELTTAI